MALVCTLRRFRSRRCGRVSGVQRPEPVIQTILSSILVVVILETASQAQSAGADRACVARGRGRTAERGTTCYEFFSEERNWFDARNLCHQYGGSLMSVTGVAVQQWLESTVEQLLADRTGIWIGLNDGRGNGTYTWDDVNGTGREARYFNWVSGQPNSGGLEQSCVFMLKRFSWQWVSDECYSPYHGYSFVCEFGSLPNDSILVEETHANLALPLDNVTEAVLSVGPVCSSRSASITSTTGLSAEREDEQHNSSVSENVVKVDTVFIVVGAIVLLTAVLLSIVWRCYRRQLKHSTSAGSQSTVAALAAASNPLDDTAVEPRDSALVTSSEMRAPLCSACGHRLEGPTRDFSPYTECITNDEHTYAQLVEPWLSSDGAGSLSNAVQPVSTGVTEMQTENAHFETEPLVNCCYSAPTCTVDGIERLVENAYVSIEPVVDHCSKADDRLISPIRGAVCSVRDLSDTSSDCHYVSE